MLWPDAIWPQDIGALAFLDGGGFNLDCVNEVVASRLHLVPRLRQLLRVPPPGLGSPLWVDDPDFDLRRHIGTAVVQSPGGEAEVLVAVEKLRARRLDRARPLWEMWFLTGLRDGRVAMFIRTHHSVADGIAGVATLASLLDVEPDITVAAPPPWSPEPAPTDAALLADAAEARRARRWRRISSLAHPVATARRAFGVLPALRELFADPGLPPTSLDCRVGPRRAAACVRTSLDEVKNVARASESKVNDVLLTAMAGGLHALLGSRGEAGVGAVMRVYVPVSLRHGQYAGARGNEIAQMAVPVPVGEPDPMRRLRAIAAETRKRKARVRPSVGTLPFTGLAGRIALKLIERQRVNVESADLPGPPVPMYLAGMRILELFPLLPLIGRVSLGVGALSYAGQFNLGIVADGDGYPDLDVFVAGVEEDLRALALEASVVQSATAAAAVSG